MNHYKADTEVSLVDTKPLFASVWLALYNQLRKNYVERRLAIAASKENSHFMGKK
jgi:hypothetical protein